MLLCDKWTRVPHPFPPLFALSCPHSLEEPRGHLTNDYDSNTSKYLAKYDSNPFEIPFVDGLELPKKRDDTFSRKKSEF